MEELKIIDLGMIIHHAWDTKEVLPAQAILKTTLQANPYAQMLDLQAPRPHAVRFSCLTTVTLSCNISEIKRNHQKLKDHLYVADTYMQQTTLNTLDTVELGMFVGLHLSLTTIAWRTKQLRQALGIPEEECPLQLYCQKLHEQQATTSCIVLRCKQKDAKQLKKNFLELNEGALGQGVEFIPYQMKIQMPNASFEGLYTLQNEATDNTGAISIVGTPETILTGTTADGKQSLQNWILKQPNMARIKQSDTPRINKWWLIHQKANAGLVQAFVDDELHSHLKTNYPEHKLDHIQHKYTGQTNNRDCWE